MNKIICYNRILTPHLSKTHIQRGHWDVIRVGEMWPDGSKEKKMTAMTDGVDLLLGTYILAISTSISHMATTMRRHCNI